MLMSANELLQEVLADPRDLDARRVYADWLIERGDPRGDFISQQLRLSEMTGVEPEYASLLASTQRLQHKNIRKWLAPFFRSLQTSEEDYSRVVVNASMNAVLHNGFLQQIAIPESQVGSCWDDLAKLEPVQGAEMIVGESISEECLRLEQAKNWRHLKISSDGWFTAYGVAQVLRWGLDSIEHLDFSGCDLGGDGARLLAGEETDLADHYDQWDEVPTINHRQLVSLGLRNTGIQDEGLKTILAASEYPNLRSLNISQCVIQELNTLKSIYGLASLEQLDLSGNNTLRTSKLAEWDGIKKLTTLSLSQSTTARSFSKLLPKPSPALTSLHLSSAQELLKDPAIVAYAAEHFVDLNIGLTRLGDAAFRELLESECMNSLVRFQLNGCSLSDDSIATLVNSNLSQLVHLDISSNKLTNVSLQRLANWENIQNVTHLRIRNNRKVSAEGFQALIDCEHFDPVCLDVGKVKDESTKDQLIERFADSLVSD